MKTKIKVNGKTYKYWSTSFSKSDINRKAKSFKNVGYKVKILKEKNEYGEYVYHLYSSVLE